MCWLDIADGLLTVKWLVVWAVAGILALQKHVYLAERWPLRRLGPPTLQHQVVDLPWTGAWLVQHSTRDGVTATVGDYLVIAKRVEWTPPGQRQYLPQCHGERPDVTLRRKFTLQDKRTPANPFRAVRIRIPTLPWMIALYVHGLAH